MTGLGILIATAFVLILGWKIRRLVRAPQDTTLRAVTFCLVSAAASFGLALPPAAEVIRRLGGAGAPRLVQNVCAFGMVFWLMLFYLYSATEPRAGRIRARWEALPLGLAVLGTTLATIAAAGQDTGSPYDSADLRVTALAAFYTVANLYLVYALSTALYWTQRYARGSQRPLAIGLWMIATALAIMAAASVVRGVLTVIRWQGVTVAPAITAISGHLIAVAIPLFLLGIGYPAARARLTVMRLRRQRRVMYRRLYPLWRMLHEAYPEDALHHTRAKPWGLPRPRGLDRRYYRRAIECRDGLVRISPYLTQAVLPATGLSEASAAYLADQLCVALQDQAKGREVPCDAIAVAIPPAPGLDADVRELVMLSDALSRRGTRTGTRDRRHTHHHGSGQELS